MVQFVTNGLYRFCEWVMRLAYLNVLWVSFSIAGLVVFGIMPATAATFSVTRKWVTGNTDIPIFRTFWKAYKKEFLRINIIGCILSVIAAVFYFDFVILGVFQGQMSIMKLIFMSLLFVYGVIVLFIFPVYAHYNIPLLHTFKYALIIGFSRPLHTLGMAAGALGVTYLILLHVTFIVFFSGSVFCLIVTWFAVKAFHSIDHSYAKRQAI